MPTPQPGPRRPGAPGNARRGPRGDPHSILGAHPHEGGVTVRTLKPLAVTVAVAGEVRAPLAHEAHGVWSGSLPTAEVPDYRLEVTYARTPASSTTPTATSPRWARSTCT